MLSRISSRKGRRRHQNQQEQEEFNDNDNGNNDNEDTVQPTLAFMEEHKREYNSKRPLIYSAPTVDSLGDESTLYRPFASPRFNQNPQNVTSRSKPGLGQQSGHGAVVIPPTVPVVGSKPMIPTTIPPKQRNQVFRKKKKNQNNNNEFQIEEDAISVHVRTIPVAERSAFSLRPIVISNQQAQNNRKVSPSWQHLQLLQKLQSITHIRQLAFSLLDSDSPNKYSKRDGRQYRSIDPVQATIQSLPATSPRLSNKKHRLPRRADVGFPNASLQEIQEKQAEIQEETEWEEASPRLIVLVTSDDLGTAVQEDSFDTDGIAGIPWAGPELIKAKEQNHHSNKRIQQEEQQQQQQQQQQHHNQLSFTANNMDNRTSMLSPPLDATYSASLGWRPRPFHDRPPGMKYTLVCPLSVDFEVGAIEPLLCSLTLYSLNSNSAENGKASEDFWFPAGDWTNKINIGSVKGDNILADLWYHRKHKAIFAHDPLILDNKQDLYIVLQVYKVTHLELAAAYINGKKEKQTTPIASDRKGLRQRMKKHFKTSKKDISMLTTYRASAVFDNCGTKFLSPLCFGINPLYPSDIHTDSMAWPNGQIQQNMQLHSFPPLSESQEEFTQRLQTMASRIANGTLYQQIPVSSNSSSFEETSYREERSTVSIATSAESASFAHSESTFSSPNKKKGVRRFMMPRRNSKKEMSPPVVEQTPVIPANVALFVSALDVDFLQSMLSTPPELAEKQHPEKVLPKILVDVSGESAIMMDPSKATLKRSSLIRLPPRAGEYMGASDFREVLFLPPRTRKNYDVDATSSYRSLINLLYLYPRLLKQESHKKKGKSQRYTIRIKLLHSITETDQETGNVKSTNKSVETFHNPAPWTGPPFLKSVYTRIPGEGNDDLKSGIPLRDEFKLKLPMVLDGKHYLHFSLFSIDFQDDLEDSVSGLENEEMCGLSIQPLAEATVPLSSSLRDPTTGTKATTIIPNGCHRLKLGDYQFQIETRLVSSIHVSDPALATALRDFPFANDSIPPGDKLTELALITRRDISRQTPSEFVPESVTYPTLFSSASGSALASHFHPLLLMHLSNLINVGTGIEMNEQFLIGNMKSFLEICRQIKSAFFASSSRGGKRWETFIKAALDALDEGNLRAVSLKHDSEEDAASDIIPTRSNPSMNHSNSGDDEDEEDFDGGAIRRRKKDSIRSGIDIRISKTFSAMESSETPFSRVAYGATKNDRMRLEAELDHDTSRFTHLVDDDETVATFATGFTTGEARMAEAREMFDKNKFLSPRAFQTDTTGASNMDEKVDNTPASGSYNHIDFSSYPRALSELGLAKRVRSAAQTMLAPCVTPNLSAVFSSANSPRFASANTASNEEKVLEHKIEKPQKPSGTDSISKKSSIKERALYSPGSDIEDSEGKRNEDFDLVSQSGSVHHTAGGIFRAPWHCPILVFSVPIGPDLLDSTIERGNYLYETVMMIWLRAWMDHADRERHTDDLKRKHQIAIPSFGYDKANDDMLFGFQSNLDVLLPLCLKSIVLRYGESVPYPHTPTARVIVDEQHTAVLEPFIEMIALSLMGQGMIGLSSSNQDRSLAEALSHSEYLLDFLVGLCTVLHPAHISALIQKLFVTLRNCEANHIISGEEEIRFEWTEETLHRVKCSRQLRLRAAERLASLPNFVALNYPSRFHGSVMASKQKKPTWTMQYSGNVTGQSQRNDDSLYGNDGLLPRSGWLSELLSRECLSICALSCEAVVAEAMAHIESHEEQKHPDGQSSLKKRPTASLKREDLLMLQSISIHAITCVHELLLRRHAMDRRFQKETSRGRIAALFAKPIIEKSLASVRWLARMESTHKVRSLWLLCFMYILQEAPESLLRDAVRSYSSPEDGRIHRFIRLLRLGSSTFQSFIDQQRHCMFPSEIDMGLSPWLLQESFNTICATIIVVVEECASPTSSAPREQQKMIQGILDLLLHVLTMPQSSVTHLRAVGGAIQALENFGPAMFLEIAGGTLQHWIRIILSLMNSIALSVRSIAVDFVISLLGNVFDMLGNIDELAMIFATVLPEVVAREAALCSVSGHISNLEDVEKSVWPIRRSFAEIEDANPLDDDRVDPQLSPILSVFCRACQAIIDGVLIEMRLQGSTCVVVGTKMPSEPFVKYTFDADEESLFEAANFFGSETAPMQRIRWLMTLKSLHKAKGQWIEAAESLIMCARTISDSIPHLRNVWRPSRFALWSDARRSLWLSTVGEEMGNPELGNEQVMSFADAFLEPPLFDGENETKSASSKLTQPTVSAMCVLLTNMTKEAVSLYGREGGLDGLAYSRLESLLKILMDVLDQHGVNDFEGRNTRFGASFGRKRYVEEEACLRRVIAGISGDMTKLAERMLLIAEEQPATPKASEVRDQKPAKNERMPYFVRVLLSGKKPTRFLESTTLPTFLEWQSPCICRVPKSVVDSLLSNGVSQSDRLEEKICSAFGKPLRDALLRDSPDIQIIFRTGSQAAAAQSEDSEDSIYVDINFVQMKTTGKEYNTFGFQSKHFFYQKVASSPPNVHGLPDSIGGTFVEMTVAKHFPCPLSRQRTLLISEFISNK